MNKEELKVFRKEMIAELEKMLGTSQNPEEDIFYYHPSEDRIVLSHALFWVMTASIKGQIAREKYLLLLRKFQKEMLEAWLTGSAYFPELLHYCNVIYNTLPIILNCAYDFSVDKNARKLGAICVVAGGYGGDMTNENANELLDDIDFHYNKAKCRKIERMLPILNKLVVDEQQSWIKSSGYRRKNESGFVGC